MQDNTERAFDEEMDKVIDAFVEEQDFHSFETALKSDIQYKADLRSRMKESYCYAALSRGVFNALTVISHYLAEHFDAKKSEKIREEIGNSFDHFRKVQERSLDSSNAEIDPEAVNKPWKLFGLSDDTVLITYDVVLDCFKKKDLTSAKDILTLLLLFAPTVSNFWNAMGYTFQLERSFENALNQYGISEEIDPDNMETKFYIVRCYIEMEQYMLAKQKVDELIEMMSLSDDIKAKYEFSIQQLKNEILGKIIL